MVPRCSPTLLLVPALIVVLGPASLPADTVVLRSGIRYYDVKTRPVGESHRIAFQNGRVVIAKNSTIRSIRPQATSWRRPTTARKASRRAETKKAPAGSAELPAEKKMGLAVRSIRPDPDFVVRVPRPPPVPTKPTREWGPVIKSVLLPGWGQIAVERKVPGFVYAGLSLFVFREYWTLRQEHAAAEAQYNDPVPVGGVAALALTGSLSLTQAAAINLAYLSQQERRVFELQTRGNNALLALGLVWGWNVLDILFGGPPWETTWFASQAVRSGPIYALQPRHDGLGVAVRFFL